MADAPSSSAQAAPAAPPAPVAVDAAHVASAPPSVRSLWPLGLIALSALMLLSGAYWTIANRPKVAITSPLIHIRELLTGGEYEEALEALNAKALIYVNLPETPEAEVRDFFLLRAAALHAAQAAKGLSRTENNAAIIADYEEAEKREAHLDAGETVRLAEAYLANGKTDKALARARSLPRSEGERRRKLIKAVVERSIADGAEGVEGSNASEVMSLLAGLAQEPDLTPEDAAWTLARQAQLLIDIGLPQDAVSKLLREIQLLKNPTRRQLGELYFLLGRANFESHELSESARQLERAMEMLDASDPLQGYAQLMLGRILQSIGQLTEAQDRYNAVLSGFADSEYDLPSLFGLAAVEAALAADDESLQSYATLVDRIGLNKSASRVLSRSLRVAVPDVIDALMARHEDRLLAGHIREALRYAVMAEGLTDPDDVSPAVLLALASTSRRIADDLLVPPPSGDRPGDDPESAVDRASREEAKRLFLSAGGYYQRYAKAIVVVDSAAASRSRWQAADSFDAAGDTETAVQEFAAYMQGASDDDPRRPEAKFRLAQAFQAGGDFPTAAALYRDLIDAKTAGGENDAVLWGDRSVVPLAQCYMSDADPSNDGEAEQRLLSVIAGRELTPDAPEFRDALVELGQLYYTTGRYPEAVERLTEAESRFPRDRAIDSIRYRLADSLRLSADQIDVALRSAVPQTERQELEKQRRIRRRDALRLYGSVRVFLAARPPARLSDLQRLYLRNSMFYQGDCAYDLGDHQAAIEFYDQAREQYASDPASLVAMVQIVNAYVQRGEWAKAVTANQRAVQHLEKFPEDVWSQPNLPMEKKHWTRWLDSRALLEQRAVAGVEPTP